MTAHHRSTQRIITATNAYRPQEQAHSTQTQDQINHSQEINYYLFRCIASPSSAPRRIPFVTRNKLRHLADPFEFIVICCRLTSGICHYTLFTSSLRFGPLPAAFRYGLFVDRCFHTKTDCLALAFVFKRVICLLYTRRKGKNSGILIHE